jgi:hypothetical protein
MNNTGARRNNSKVLEGVGTPLQEAETFFVTFHFEIEVLLESVLSTVLIDLNTVVDNQVNRDTRVNLCGITAQVLERISHGSKIDNGRYTSKVLRKN